MERGSVWKNKQYMNVVIAQTFSSFADWMFLICMLAMAAVELRVSSIEISILMLAFVIPQLFISPFAGGLADRFDRKYLLLLSEIGRAMVVLLTPIASDIYFLAMILLLLSLFKSFFIPAKNGKLKEVLHPEQLQEGVAVSGMIDNASKIFGPSLGGLLIAMLHFSTLFYVVSVAYFLSVVVLLFLKKDQYSLSQTEQATTKKSSIGLEGFQMIASSPFIFVGMIAMASGLFFIQLIDSQLVLFLDQSFRNTSQMLGFSMAASGAGTLLITALLRKRAIRDYYANMYHGVFVLGISFFLAILCTYIPEYLALLIMPICFFIGGFAIGLVLVTFQITVQTSTPVDKIGRMFGAISSVNSLVTILGLTLGGVIAQIVGVSLTILITAICLVILAMALKIYEMKNSHTTKPVMRRLN
ncbi:MFS transporter [Alkalicoccobacillus porphyridii]|uniref:MFS transporter n=1 Tax=Alkalicoccobacillus porphyridii TaxID=2597270 RepID=A0A554A2J9_9BACI|nr:MFS transporter [Alkalicoccobacillus porphyridii]TSB47908.1 MFS transporter [Alkalicoccobacillus porphyridii]